MRILLDTHVLLWWMAGDKRLARPALEAIANRQTDVAVSVATFWEIAIKKSLRRIDVDLRDLAEESLKSGFEELPVKLAHTLRLTTLPSHHTDPFDRMLIAQAITEGRQLVTRDEAILAYAGIDGFAPLRA